MASIYKHCFTPLSIRGVSYKNRLEISPHVPGWGAADGTVSRELAAFWTAYARGGAALLNMGNCAVDMAEAKDETQQIDLSRDDVIVGLSNLREACKRHGAVLSLEINHAGRGAGKYYPQNRLIGPSNIPLESDVQRAMAAGLQAPVVEAMSADKIDETVKKYASAAERCKRAGLEHVLVHGAHGNLITQFLSPMSNKRKDGYGGSLRNRARFGVEVLQAIRQAVGDDIVIEMRLSAEDGIPEGVLFPDLLEFAMILEDYVDVFMVSYGMMAMPSIVSKMMAGPFFPEMHNLDYVKAFKQHLSKAKVSAVGTLHSLENCEQILANGWADFAAMCRPFIADPDLARKGARNQAGEIRPCIRCMCCIERVSTWRTIGCSVNPFSGRELEFASGRMPRAAQPKKVMVVGGGLAGLQAAWTGTQMGHDVTVYEKEPILGGNFNHVGIHPFKHVTKAFYDYFMPRAAGCGAKLVLNAKVTRELVEREAPDVLVIATGAEHVLPPIKGVHLPHVRMAHEIDASPEGAGQSVAVIGAGAVGLESAYRLACLGRDVTVVDHAYADEVAFSFPRFEMANLLAEMDNVRIIYGARIDEISAAGLLCTDRASGEGFQVACTDVLIAAGLRPRREVYDELLHNDAVSECDIHLIGDAAGPRQIGQAVNEAFDLMAHLD
jgi:2,4-dienoyl-CoA reductase-like NADH-dependent reductase (Old Yellow Enzyme family)/thioredoxin reductase